MSRSVAPAASTPRLVGRPRRLTLDGLLDTAIEMGLADLNMKDLAARLGVGIATLYRYVANRDELIRLASGRQAYRQTPADTGQPLAELVRDYAASLYSSIGANPHLVIGFIEARLGIAAEIEFLENYLAAMRARGYGIAAAMDLYRSLGMIVLGAAAARAHFSALSAQGTDQATELDRAFAVWEPDELPNLREAASYYADADAICDWRTVLDRIIADFERKHGKG
ncbi:TetR/AcrR family transcriptional regulator [Flavisphingomonas formosensis]|uniref:TetR/AcrR family transcriptional regulator n=1 Tax=Flavisphingomonas formosensis TaxID=861534 RepID=UPI0012FBA0CD|nr:TetR family transcriptional regulator [Sphingomonas formosensis]